MIKNGNLILSQSMTKELGLFVIDDQVEEVAYCPKRFYAKYVEENYPDTCSTPMLQGKFAESILLGSGANGEVVDDLPRKRNGEKTVGQERIEKQMERLYGFMYAHGVRIKPFNTQVRLIAQYSKHVWLRGEFDIFPTLVDGRLSIVDVKTTKDVYSDFFSINDKYVRSSSTHCWGDYAKIAKNQPLFYHHIARNFTKIGLDGMIRFHKEHRDKYEALFAMGDAYDDVGFYFMVAGVGVPNLDDQLVMHEYEYTSSREILLEALISAATRRIRESIRNQFEPIPTESLCRSCALKDICSQAKI